MADYQKALVPEGKDQKDFARTLRLGFDQAGQGGAEIKVTPDKHDDSVVMVEAGGPVSLEQNTFARKYGLDL